MDALKLGRIISTTALMISISLTSACRSSFDVDFLPDNHYLKTNVPDSTFTQTTHPVVLVHGLYGFDHIFGMPYWYDIPEVLEQGGSTVYIAEVSGTTTPANRGEQLIEQLDDIRVAEGHLKFNIFGHSLGGPTIRYVAEVRPDLVASITTVSGANFGSDAANNETVNLPLVRPIIAFMGNALGHVIDMVSQNSFEQSILESTDAMDKAGAAEFNATYTTGLPSLTTDDPNYCNGAQNADPRVGFSHGTNQTFAEGDQANMASAADFSNYYANDTNGGPAGPYNISGNPVYIYSFSGNVDETNDADPLDGLHRSVSALIEGDDDDGMVERCSTHVGYVIKDNFYMNHLDVMNWFIGLRDKRSPYPPAIYRAHVNHLKSKGL